MIGRVLLVGAIAFLVAGARVAAAPQGGDCSFPPNKKLPRSASSWPEGYVPPDGHSRDDLLGFIGANFGVAIANQMDADTDPGSGCAMFVEKGGEGLPGRTDATTIAVRTDKNPLWLCSIIFMHEYDHWTRAHLNPDDPEDKDPETEDENPCGACNHAEMGLTDLMRAEELHDDPDASGDLKKDICGRKDSWRAALGKQLSKCRHEGGADCLEDWDTMPNVDEFMDGVLENCGN